MSFIKTSVILRQPPVSGLFQERETSHAPQADDRCVTVDPVGKTGSRCSLLRRLLLLVTGTLFLAVLLATVSIIHNARHAIRAEGDSFALFAGNLIENLLYSNHADTVTTVELLPYIEALDELRHVSVRIQGLKLQMPAETESEKSVPNWFVQLLTIRQNQFYQRIINGGVDVGQIIVAADPADEIKEVWDDVQPLLGIAFCLLPVTFLLLYQSIRSGLAPLNELITGFERLEQGDFPVRVNENAVLELHRIHNKFNWLANVLQETLENNRNLAAHMVNLREEEHIELARELHDELAPYLFAIKIQISATRKASVVQKDQILSGRLVEVSVMISGLEHIIHRMLHRLRPLMLDDLGLKNTLQHLVAGWQEQTQIKCDLNIQGEIDTLTDTLQITIYRAVQEGLTNIAKHARADTARIRLHVYGNTAQDSSEMLELLIEDDGPGDTTVTKPGFGLLGMQERVQALGGSLLFSASNCTGFTVRIELPVTRLVQSGTNRLS